MAGAGVAVTRVGPGHFDGSGLTEAALRGGRYVAATSLAARVEAGLAALRASARSLVYVYWGELDKAGHVHGVASARWGEELEDVDAAVRGAEFLHFGVALEEWGSGLASAAHDELLARMAAAGVTRPWLRCYAANPRGRVFWEKHGWVETGERSRGPMPPHAELLTYAYDPGSSGTRTTVAT